MAQPTLSGVAPERAIALAPGKPLLSVEEANRLILRHGLNRELARAQVQEAVAAVVPLAPEEEEALAFLAARLGDREVAREVLEAMRAAGYVERAYSPELARDRLFFRFPEALRLLG